MCPRGDCGNFGEFNQNWVFEFKLLVQIEDDVQFSNA